VPQIRSSHVRLDRKERHDSSSHDRSSVGHRRADRPRKCDGPRAGRPARRSSKAATANLNPWTEAKVDTKNPERGPLLIISGEKDNTVPWAIANASYKKQKRNAGVTEIVELPSRGHALVVDSGWREVADTALAFIRRFV
jgi:pimeloyl-ACP methyl ester carboxylesterase